MSTAPRSQEDIIQEQVSAKAKQAASAAAATGNIVKVAFLSTISESRTVGEKAVVFGSLTGLVAFFLPWLTVLGTFSGSGLRAALYLSALFWLYPASMVFSFVMSWFLLNAAPKKRILAARWFILVGTLWAGPGVLAISNELSGAAGIGLYLATMAAAAILIGGILQISECIKRIDLAV